MGQKYNSNTLFRLTSFDKYYQSIDYPSDLTISTAEVPLANLILQTFILLAKKSQNK